MNLLISNTLDPPPVAVSRSALAMSRRALTTSGRANARVAVNATKLFARANGLDLIVVSLEPTPVSFMMHQRDFHQIT